MRKPIRVESINEVNRWLVSENSTKDGNLAIIIYELGQFLVFSCRVQVAGCRYQVSGIRFQVSGFRFQVAGYRWMQGAGCRLPVAGYRIVPRDNFVPRFRRGL